MTEVGGELHVLIKEANNLIAMKAAGSSDTFVKGSVLISSLRVFGAVVRVHARWLTSIVLSLCSYLHPSKSKSTKKKTPVVKKSLNPNYDHTFVYSGVTLEQLRGMCLELTVWDREAMLSNEFLGGVRLSCGEGEIVLLARLSLPKGSGIFIFMVLVYGFSFEVWTLVLVLEGMRSPPPKDFVFVYAVRQVHVFVMFYVLYNICFCFL